ncbi:MAG: serine/threonine protein kinase [Proteobacteria bacterium]|nr:serine/threonine protein kinase [Pseudomonadota bacterium]
MRPGEQFERYELVERIAVGGMAEVFRAMSYGPHGFEKVVAIKRILPELAANGEFERRFIAEAKLACSLNHANLVQVFDFSRFGESLYLVMEYVDGTDLARLLRMCGERGEQVPLGAALHIAIELCKGLDFAHGRGIIHRDISPPNILLSRSGEVKIADFGIAKASGVVTSRSARNIMGKWRYMSPEQTRGQELDGRSDLFSAAAVLFELFCGQRLIPGDDSETIVRNIHEMDIPRLSALRPGIPPALDELMARALARDRDRRIPHASELWQGLVDVSYAHGVKATAMSVAALVVPRHATGQDASPYDEPSPATSMRLIDDIINSELKRSRSAPQPMPGRSRVTVRDMRVPELPSQDELEGATTLVRKRERSDGMTEWTLERTPPVSGQKARESSGTKWWAYLGLFLLLLAGVAVGVWFI